MEALVSIITPTFNSEKFIAQTITSVQNQTFTNWELLIVDDCSTDETVKIIQNFNDERIKLIQLQKNCGAGVARQTALEAASGTHIAFLDADDLWLPQKLQRQLDFMAENRLPFTFSFYDWIDEDGKALGKRIEAPRNLSYKQVFFCNYVGNLTGIYEVGFFGKIEIPSIRKRQDWIIWLKILKKIRSAKPVPESLALYRIRENSMSASKTKLLKYNYKVYRDFHRMNFLAALFCMGIFLFVQLLVKPRYAKSV